VQRRPSAHAPGPLVDRQTSRFSRHVLVYRTQFHRFFIFLRIPEGKGMHGAIGAAAGLGKSAIRNCGNDDGIPESARRVIGEQSPIARRVTCTGSRVLGVRHASARECSGRARRANDANSPSRCCLLMSLATRGGASGCFDAREHLGVLAIECRFLQMHYHQGAIN